MKGLILREEVYSGGGTEPEVWEIKEPSATVKKEALKVVQISPREKEVLKWLYQGKTSWETARILNLSERTVNFHVYNVMEKLEAVNRPQMITIALQMGFLDLR